MIETIHSQLLLAMFADWVGRQQAAVIAYLIEENRVLKEQIESSGTRLLLTDEQRRRPAAKGKPLGRKILRTMATIVTPDTILAPIPTGECPSALIPETASAKRIGCDAVTGPPFRI